MTRRPRADRPVQQPFTLIMPTRSPGDRRALEAKLTHLLALPQDQNPLTAALDAIGTVHFARFVFVDDTRLAFVMTYDGDMTAYVNEFVDHLGPVFDMLLQHMADAPPLPVQRYRREFLDYLARNDKGCLPPLYSAYPDRTVRDILRDAGG